MRNISFMLTTEQVRNRTKTVTRRLGWNKLSPGDLLQGCVKCQGLKPGEAIERLCVVRVVSVRRERLDEITDDDVAREGFPEMNAGQFVAMFCDHMKTSPSTEVTRIEFEYVEAVNK